MNEEGADSFSFKWKQKQIVLWVRKGLWGSLVQPCAQGKATLDCGTQGHIELSSECIAGWRYPSLFEHLLKCPATLAR